MSLKISYMPYTGKIDTSSKQYMAAKKMYDEGNAEKTVDPMKERYERDAAKLKALKAMLGDKSEVPSYEDLFGNNEETIIRNLMGMFDEDGDFINPYGVAGMDATGKSLFEMHQIIHVSETARQDMFEETKRHFALEYGIANGDTTKRTEVFTRYQLSVDKEDRLKGTWTLGQYEKQYTIAFYRAVKAANPEWELGMPFDRKILDSVSREDIDNSLVKVDGEYGEELVRKNLDIKV